MDTLAVVNCRLNNHIINSFGALFKTRRFIATREMRHPCSAPQLRREFPMSKLELIITCENCGHVEQLEASNDIDSKRLFEQFNCPGQCSPKYYSYFSIGEIPVEEINKPLQVAQVA